MQSSILVIEDNELNMELATDLLEAAGYNVLQARDAESGIRLALTELPSLILMDINLPGMDGLNATLLLREDPRTKDIPVIALTAYSMVVDEDAARVFGCIGYITKPIDTRAFVRSVQRFLPKAA